MWDVWNALWVKCTDINQKCGKLTLTYCDQCCHLLFWGQCHNRLSLNQSHSVIHWNQYKTVMLMVSLKVPPLQCIDDIDCVNGVITLKYKKNLLHISGLFLGFEFGTGTFWPSTTRLSSPTQGFPLSLFSRTTFGLCRWEQFEQKSET